MPNPPIAPVDPTTLLPPAGPLGALDTRLARNPDWLDGWAESAFHRPPMHDIPTLTWASSFATALSSPAVFAPPVVNTGSNTVGWDGESDTVFRYFPGTFNTGNGGNNDLALYGSLKPGGISQAARWGLVVSFVTAATNKVVELPMYGSTDGVIIEVNGQPISDTIVRGFTGTNEKMLTLTFPVARSRTIRVWLDPAIGFMGVRVPTGQTVTKPPAFKNVIAVIGDSWVNGAGDSSVNPPGATMYETFAPRLLRLMGADAMLLAGIGGTGWLAGTDTGGAAANYASRLSAVLAKNPGALVFYGSQNDPNTDPNGTLRNAVASALQTASAVPKIYVIPTMIGGYSAANAAVKAATLAAGRTFVDMSDWIKGTGAVDSPQRDGNRDVFLFSNSNLHMTIHGHRAAARSVYRRMMTP